MRLQQLRLHDFRSYPQVTIMPPDGVTVFVGENGAGKTNLLEAVHLCCLGRSHRTPFDRDMIRLGCRTSAVYARVQRRLTADEVGVSQFDHPHQLILLNPDHLIPGIPDRNFTAFHIFCFTCRKGKGYCQKGE